MGNDPDTDTGEVKKRRETESGEGGFLSRWSRRKVDQQEKSFADSPERLESSLGLPVGSPLESIESQPLTPAPVDPVIREEEDETSESAGQTKKVLTDEDMPGIDTLDDDSDYSGFMSEGVSEELRKLALRKLFAGVGFNIRDGLDDYDDDFRSFEALGDIITSDMKHQMELEEERKKEAERLAEEQKEEADGSNDGDQDAGNQEKEDQEQEKPSIETTEDLDSMDSENSNNPNGKRSEEQ